MVLTSADPVPADLDRFRSLIEQHLGLRLTDPDTRRLRQVLARRLAARHCSAPAYFDLVESNPAGEISTWATELTITETYFLRHIEQFNALTGTVVPERRKAGADPSRLSLLCAGCATGEEAYSLAIALRQQNSAAQPTILGVDINSAALEQARRARYTPWSLRAVPDDVRKRWFTTTNGDVELDPSLLKLVRFEQHNLMLDNPEIWRPGTYDAVFCRNALMYLRPAVMEQIVRRIAISLQPGGFLFLGSAETLRGISTSFEVRESHGAFYYQRSGTNPVAVTLGPRAPRAAAATSAATTAARTAARPAATAAAGSSRGSAVPLPLPLPQARAPEADAPAEPRPGGPYDEVLDLLSKERFTQALAQLHELAGDGDGTGEDAADPEAMLLRAALLTHSGQLAEAERASNQLLKADPASAGAHLLLAIVRECERDDEAAVAHCQSAVRFAPAFAMPQVHLGRLAIRAARPGRARHHFDTAIDLLPRESDRMLMLFGGGFSREALISMCRTQLTQAAAGS